MLTDKQRQQIAVLCRRHQIAKLWLLDGPLPDGCDRPAGLTAIVAFHSFWPPDHISFGRIGFEVEAITGPVTGFYPVLALPPAVAEKTLRKAAVIYGHSPLDGETDGDAGWREAVARFCRKNRIARLWAMNEPLDDMDSAPTVTYEFAAGHYAKGGYFDLFDMQDELRCIIGAGATLHPMDDLRPSDREKICQQAEFHYADHLAG